VGEPENPGDFVPVVVGEWGRRYGTVYVARHIWERLRPGAQEFTFYVQDRGRCRLHFDLPVGRLDVSP
jgi:hypothetical protein